MAQKMYFETISWCVKNTEFYVDLNSVKKVKKQKIQRKNYYNMQRKNAMFQLLFLFIKLLANSFILLIFATFSTDFK